MSPLAKEQQRLIKTYHSLNKLAIKGRTVMVGSSLMEGFPIYELMQREGISEIVYNRGIRGFRTIDLLENLDACVLDLAPSRIFINIGTNDIGAPGDDMGMLIGNYREILLRICHRLPGCQINMLAYYPISRIPAPMPPEDGRKPRTLEAVHRANTAVKALAEEMGIRFIDLNAAIMDEDGYTKTEYAMDVIHLLPSAYYEILKRLKPFLMEAAG